MPGRRVPPPHRFQPVLGYEIGLSKGLVLAYPMLEGSGNQVVNYGLWGHDVDLTVGPGSNWTEREGFRGLDFSSASAVASRAMTQTIPSTWSYAFWGRLDTYPSGSTTMNALTLQGSGATNMRVQADQTGLWSWQRRATADTYSVLYPADYQGNSLRLYVGTFTGVDTQPPVQLRTTAGLSMQPLQPNMYQSFNVGAGPQQKAITGVYIGNSASGGSVWDGVIGPLYFWDRVISDAEVWQLWQDPYAPLRRRTGHLNIPSLMTPLPDYGKSGAVTGKPRYDNQVFTDGTALFINLHDNYFYLNNPTDVFGDDTGAQEPVLISLVDGHSYSDISLPTDTIVLNDSGVQEPLLISLIDEYSYVVKPTDMANAILTDTVVRTVINVTDEYSYMSSPVDGFDETLPWGSQEPVTIGVTENVSYLDLPDENISSSWD